MTVPDFFGINLGHNSIKVAQIKQSGSKPKLLALNSIPTAVGILDNDSESGIQTLATEITKIADTSGIKTKNCVLSVPEVSIFSRLITLPKMDDKEVGEAIQWALKPLVPIPLDSVNVSFLEIDEKSIQGNTFIDWYVVAAPKNVVTRFQSVCEKAGLNLIALETEALAISRMISYNYPDFKKKDIMILDLGADSTNVILSRNGVVMFSQSISTGSDALSKVIAADFGIDIVQAEKYKIAYGMDFENGEGKIAKSIQPIVDIILNEVQRTLAYYREKIGGSTINDIFLVGGGADLLKLEEYLSQKLGINAKKADPLINIENNLKQTKMNVKSFNVAIGLSLKGIAEV